MEAVKSVRVLGVKRRRQGTRCEEVMGGVGQSNSSGRPFRRTGIRTAITALARSSLARNYRNFVGCQRPRRVLFLDDGYDWCDFPENVMVSLSDAFSNRTPVVEIWMRERSYIVDFLRMFMINLDTGVQQSVAWIDGEGKCFFPSVFFDGNGDDKLMSNSSDKIVLKLGLQIGGTDNSEPSDEHEELISNRGLVETGEALAENVALMMTHSVLRFDGLGDKLVRLDREDDNYRIVNNTFVTGFAGFGWSVAPDNVCSIHRFIPKGSAQERLERFEKQIEIMKKHRGDANLRCGWFGTAKESVVWLVRNGFARSGGASVGMAYGSGVFLAPEHSSYASVKFCDVDEDGLQHMVFCRVIMGSMERVQPGSEHFHPSSEDFDSGVDNIQNPRLYVIWNTHMNTHVHPEYLVSFKLSPSQQEYLAGLNNVCGNVDVSMTNDQKSTSTP